MQKENLLAEVFVPGEKIYAYSGKATKAAHHDAKMKKKKPKNLKVSRKK